MNNCKKPIAIFRHSPTENAGYFSIFLDKLGIKYRVIKIDQGEEVPNDASLFAGLVFMGGTMSVNDDLPWIKQNIKLIRQAIQLEIPVLGHCLGGQLMSKALNGIVEKNEVKELGWGQVELQNLSKSQSWFGNLESFKTFHWHGETFSIPQDATLLLSSEFCQNQAFEYKNIHLGMQCHIEMIPDMINTWVQDGLKELNDLNPIYSKSVQLPQQIQHDTLQELQKLHQIAENVYHRWIQSCKF